MINYSRFPEWSQEVLRLTQGKGVERIIEVGGPGTLNQSIQSIAIGGEVVLIGFVANDAHPVSFFNLFKSSARYRVSSVGSREDFENMNRALIQH